MVDFNKLIKKPAESQGVERAQPIEPCQWQIEDPPRETLPNLGQRERDVYAHCATNPCGYFYDNSILMQKLEMLEDANAAYRNSRVAKLDAASVEGQSWTYRKSVMGAELYRDHMWMGSVVSEIVAQEICAAFAALRAWIEYEAGPSKWSWDEIQALIKATGVKP